MSKKYFIFTLAAAFIFTGCTSITVKPASLEAQLKHVCIERNPKVMVGDFLNVLQEGFERHGISTEVYDGERPVQCDAVMTYTALRNWDMAPYLSEAELNLQKEGKLLASAKYYLKGKGGFSLMKFQGTRKKMDPVIDQLLKDYK